MFRYLRDPLCLAAWGLYGANRWLVKPLVPAGEWFFRGHFNDLLLVACALPPVLWLHGRLGLREPNAPPSSGEVFLHLAVWSIIFELVAPRLLARATADPWDVLVYWAGGLLAWAFWNRAALFGRHASEFFRPRNLTAQTLTPTRME
jgi:hypothetical protein